ncbi:RNA polymerase sigma-H factor [Streptomyces phage ZL12]|uniref:RNA polymerase sigma-H factor n=1 Tax=Streptomyces phage ZL12 TaxID=2570911 RepID=D0UWB2_9CAUD|nr:RNA polymerase sigma-H factor [Streptomyces phage ZL12]ACX71084.1 RNA polymerase sigma-H factor [Streptomyces phage ZL12]
MSTLTELRAAGCRTWKLTHQNIGTIDDAVDKDGIYAKGYWESIDGKTTVTGLRIGTGEARIVAKFGTWIVRHPNGQWAVHTPDCARCDDSGIDPEDSDPGSGPSDHSMGEPPALEPCRNCGPGAEAPRG